MAIKDGRITLEIMTRKMCHEFYMIYVADKLMTETTYKYNYNKIEKYFQLKSNDTTRMIFSILLGEKVIGEIQLKYIDLFNKTGTLSIILANDSYKNKGYGTEAEELLIIYAFTTLNLSKVLADTTSRNKRSKHILLKLGFKHLKEENEMSYYELLRNDWFNIPDDRG